MFNNSPNFSTPIKPNGGSIFTGATNNNNATTSTGFAFNKTNDNQSSTGSLFPGAKKDEAKPANNAFSGFSFGAKKDDNATTAPAAFSFGAKKDDASSKPTATSSLFGTKKDNAATTTPASTGFSFGAKKDDAKPAATNSLFGAKKDDTATATPASTGFSFGAKKDDAKPAATNSLFGAKKDDTATTTPASTGFSFGAKKDDAKPAATNPLFAAKKDDTATTTPASTGFSFGAKKDDAKPAATGSLFGGKKDETGDKKTVSFSATKPEEKKPLSIVKSTEVGSAPVATNAIKPVTAAPEPVSLEHQTVQDLIKNWANKLVVCQSFFNTYSTSINKWDGVLTENSEKLSKLYSDVLETEQLSSTIDQNLLYLEKQQDDIENFLDYYDNKINDIYVQDDSILLTNATDGNNVTGNNNTGRLANDKKREAAYSNAILLDKSLDSLTTDLTTLISEINEVNDTFNDTIYKSTGEASKKGSKDDGDDSNENSISSIIKLMNIHLNSLKWLESNSEVLKKKIDSYKSI